MSESYRSRWIVQHQYLDMLDSTIRQAVDVGLMFGRQDSQQGPIVSDGGRKCPPKRLQFPPDSCWVGSQVKDKDPRRVQGQKNLAAWGEDESKSFSTGKGGG